MPLRSKLPRFFTPGILRAARILYHLDVASVRPVEVVAALAPVCVQRFQTGADSASNLVALKKVDAWSQGDFIEKGGWATIPGAKPIEQVSAVAKACASLLAPA